MQTFDSVKNEVHGACILSCQSSIFNPFSTYTYNFNDWLSVLSCTLFIHNIFQIWNEIKWFRRCFTEHDHSQLVWQESMTNAQTTNCYYYYCIINSFLFPININIQHHSTIIICVIFFIIYLYSIAFSLDPSRFSLLFNAFET